MSLSPAAKTLFAKRTGFWTRSWLPNKWHTPRHLSEDIPSLTLHATLRSVKILAKQRTYTTLAGEARKSTRSNKRKAEDGNEEAEAGDEPHGENPAPAPKAKAKAKGKAAAKKTKN